MQIDIANCGVCHSDLHTVRSELKYCENGFVATYNGPTGDPTGEQ